MNKMQNYPLSSCNCYNCNINKYKFPGGVPTNMSVRNNDVSNPYYNCYNSKIFDYNIQPRLIPNEYINLNPKAIDNLYDTSFKRVNCDVNEGCDKTVYVSTDPRLISSAHSKQQLSLDIPPLNGKVKLSKIYTDPRLQNYGKQYTCYEDINAGQIEYYIDKQFNDAFATPLYENPAYATSSVLVDPMGSIKPQYNRAPVKNNNVLDTKRDNFDHNLSFLQDSNEHREDLISRQQRKNNQQNYQLRWNSLK